MKRHNSILSIISRGMAFGVPAGIMVMIGFGLTGCTGTANQVLPTELKSRVVSATGTTEDHMAAAKIYEHHAKRLLDEAAQLEQQAAELADSVQVDRTVFRNDQVIQKDPNGVKRDRLMMTAQDRRAQAAQMVQLYAEQYNLATERTAKQQ